jgi:hypothetical protein
MARFLVESSHTARECVWALRELVHESEDTLDQYEWGCKDGEHVGWAIVEAETKFEVLARIPRVLRPQTHIVQLNQFTAEEVVAFHEGELAARAG